MNKLDQVLKFLKENGKMVAFWAIILVLAIGAWSVFGGKNSTSAGQESVPSLAVAPGEGGMVILPAKPAVVAPAPAQSVAPAPAGGSIAAPANVARSAGSEEYQYIAKLSNLRGPQLEKYEKACADREAVLAFWAKGPGKKVEETRQALKDAKANKADEKTLAELQIKNDLLIQMENDMRTVLRANVLVELSIEQQRRWTGFVLNKELTRKLSRIELSEKQQDLVRQLADDAADKLVKADTFEKDPFLMGFKDSAVMDPLVKQARDKVLTIEQRARMPGPGKMTVKAMGSASAQ